MAETIASEAAELGRLALAGSLTIRDMPRICTQLQDALANQAAVTIDCGAATDIDLTFVQLVLAARKSAAAAGKSVSFIPPEGEALADLLARAGLAGPECDHQTFWFNKVADGAENDPDHR